MVISSLLLTLAVFFEAGAEPYAGKVAVCDVVLTRVALASSPTTINQVILKDKQFSFIIKGRLPRVRADVFTSKAWEDSVKASQQCLRKGPSLKATHYHATYVSPAWAKRMVRVGRVGKHIFYKGLR